MGFKESAPKDAFAAGDYIIIYDAAGNERRVLVEAAGLASLLNTEGATSKEQVGLGNVDNTADLSKPVSSAQQTAIDDAVADVETSAYGSISAEGNSTLTTISASSSDFSNKVQITIFDTAGISNDTTPSHTNDEVKIDEAGDFQILAVVSFFGTAAKKYSFGLFKNNGATKLGSRSTLSATGNRDFLAIAAQATLAVDDTIELWVQNEDGTENLFCEDVTLSVFQVG